MDRRILAESLRGAEDHELAELERATSRWVRRNADGIGDLWQQSLVTIRRELQRRARPTRKSRADFSMDAILGGAR